MRCPPVGIRCYQARCRRQALSRQCHCRIHHRCRYPHPDQPASQGTRHDRSLGPQSRRIVGIHRPERCRTRQPRIGRPGHRNLGRHVLPPQAAPQDAIGTRGRRWCYRCDTRPRARCEPDRKHSLGTRGLPVRHPSHATRGGDAVPRRIDLFDLFHDLSRISLELRGSGKDEENHLQAQPRPGIDRTGSLQHWFRHVYGNARHLRHCPILSQRPPQCLLPPPGARPVRIRL
mmetsp:Transcript_22966/g.48890  ORF Transcript_22966/g.48890 Transcript_22966/m.48890 type:complete len:231 (+) Transcript_22966:1046-1738(+)